MLWRMRPTPYKSDGRGLGAVKPHPGLVAIVRRLAGCRAGPWRSARIVDRRTIFCPFDALLGPPFLSPVDAIQKPSRSTLCYILIRFRIGSSASRRATLISFASISYRVKSHRIALHVVTEAIDTGPYSPLPVSGLNRQSPQAAIKRSRGKDAERASHISSALTGYLLLMFL